MTTPRPDPRLGSDIGPYRIETVIGRGGMGVVYLATHTGLDRRVALKLLSHDYADDEAFRARFLRESKLAAAIDHPNIIPIYDAGEVEGTYYLAMRYVEGVDLATRLREGPLEPRRTVSLLAQVAGALDAAHAAGLVHRDVKPANLLIASGQGVDRDDHVYLTDFGLTKQRGSQSGLTRGGAFLGTLEYVAPEQIEGRVVDGRADQYALAAVAAECLTGKGPFPRDSDLALINAHLHDAPPSLHLRFPTLPTEVDAVIARGLAKRPEDRFPDCKAFVDDLRDALGVTSTQTRPPVSMKPDRRVPIVIGVVAVIGLVAVIGFVLASGAGATPMGPSPSADLAASSPSASLEASPTEDVFPNAAEAALLSALPSDIVKDCERGSYGAVTTNDSSGVPSASIRCVLDIGTGANAITVRRFEPQAGLPIVARFQPRFLLSFLSGTRGIQSGDCSKSPRAFGTWQLVGNDAGSILCYIDRQSGDAILYWTNDERALLVNATNQRGESPALYEFFGKYARFIAP